MTPESFEGGLEAELRRDRLRNTGFPARAIREARRVAWPLEKQDGTTWGRKLRIVLGMLRGHESIIFLCGPTGTGKTTLATAAALHWLDGGPRRSVRCETWGWQAARARSVYQPSAKETELDVLNAAARDGLFILDEYGQRRDTPIEQQFLPLLLCRRYDGGKHTIIISTEKAEELKRSLEVTILSRMAESGGFVTLDETMRARV